MKSAKHCLNHSVKITIYMSMIIFNSLTDHHVISEIFLEFTKGVIVLTEQPENKLSSEC